MSHAVIHADALTCLRGNRWLVQNGYIPKAHAILCDPPYGLEFMGKEWDRPKPSGLMATRDKREAKHLNPAYPSQTASPFLAAAVNKYVAGEDFEAWVSEWAGLLIDYVYPGAVGLFFGGTRTYHRLATGLEDAGWEITDCMMWVQGQGFPKSASIGKLLDKEAGAAREVVGGVQRKPFGYEDRPWKHAEDAYTSPITSRAAPLAARWEGYGTALKPAFEPVVVARAPRGKRTYAALAREFGTGALAIDAARIGTGAKMWAEPRGGICPPNSAADAPLIDNPQGRFPANFGLICTCDGDEHDADCPVTELQDSARYFYVSKAAAWEREAGLHGFAKRPMREPGAEFGKMTMWNGENGDEAWRAKNPNTPRANVHPTVKPIRLAEYLARLILPPELDTPRRLLVPFAGSGSEMIGARLAGWDAVTGIEREAEYVALAEARLAWWAQFASYDDARAAYEKERKAKPALVVIEDKPEQIARTGR